MVYYTMPCSIYIRQQTVNLWVWGCFYEVAVTLTFIQGHNICMQRILRHTGNNYMCQFCDTDLGFWKEVSCEFNLWPKRIIFAHITLSWYIKGKKNQEKFHSNHTTVISIKVMGLKGFWTYCTVNLLSSLLIQYNTAILTTLHTE